MDIYALEAFKVIAETGSLTRAAERLHVSQPAMSAALKKFEAELGAPLFDREANRIRLNAAGEAALERVNAILRAVEKLREDVRRALLENDYEILDEPVKGEWAAFAARKR
mgnify:CR=1 FL=1